MEESAVGSARGARFVEHERKFVVSDASLVRGLVAADDGTEHITQAYLAVRNGVSVRVRVSNDTGIVTVKGRREGARRAEREATVPTAMAELMLQACDGATITKARYPFADGGLGLTVDVFAGDIEGLVLAEIEVPPNDLDPPRWGSREVTDDDRFYNQRLARVPFATWPDRAAWALHWRQDR
jgi:CYTH domain-containing protein